MKSGIEKIEEIEINWDVTEKELREKREELRLKMIEHQNIAHPYRMAIDTIDRFMEAKKVETFVGKCYMTDQDDLIRIEYYNDTMYPCGTIISIDGKGIAHISFNAIIWDEDIKHAKKISNKQITDVLKEAITQINEKIAWAKP